MSLNSLIHVLLNSFLQSKSWSWKHADPKPQIAANAKYNSYNSLGDSAGIFCGVRRQSRRKHVIWIIAISEMGVIFLNFLWFSRRKGKYLVKSISKCFLSTGSTRQFVHEVTKGDHPRSCGLMYKIPARDTKKNCLLLLNIQRTKLIITSSRCCGF